MTELVMTKAVHENVERTTKCDHDFFESDVKVRDQFHVTAKYRVAAHWDCSVNVSLNDKIPILFCNFKH